MEDDSFFGRPVAKHLRPRPQASQREEGYLKLLLDRLSGDTGQKERLGQFWTGIVFPEQMVDFFATIPQSPMQGKN